MDTSVGALNKFDDHRLESNLAELNEAMANVADVEPASKTDRGQRWKCMAKGL